MSKDDLTACPHLPFSLLFLLLPLLTASLLPLSSVLAPVHTWSHGERVQLTNPEKKKKTNFFCLGLFFPILMSWLITAPSANASGESVPRGSFGPTVDTGSYSSFGHLMIPHLDCAVAISTLLTQGNMDKLLPVHQRAGKN